MTYFIAAKCQKGYICKRRIVNLVFLFVLASPIGTQPLPYITLPNTYNPNAIRNSLYLRKLTYMLFILFLLMDKSNHLHVHSINNERKVGNSICDIEHFKCFFSMLHKRQYNPISVSLYLENEDIELNLRYQSNHVLQKIPLFG